MKSESPWRQERGWATGTTSGGRQRSDLPPSCEVGPWAFPPAYVGEGQEGDHLVRLGGMRDRGSPSVPTPATGSPLSQKVNGRAKRIFVAFEEMATKHKLALFSAQVAGPTRLLLKHLFRSDPKRWRDVASQQDNLPDYPFRSEPSLAKGVPPPLVHEAQVGGTAATDAGSGQLEEAALTHCLLGGSPGYVSNWVKELPYFWGHVLKAALAASVMAFRYIPFFLRLNLSLKRIQRKGTVLR